MAKSRETWDTVTIKPLTGILDNRSLPSDIPPGAFRARQNFKLSAGTKLCRRAGHERLFAGLEYDLLHPVGADHYDPVYTNWDLHDQSVTTTSVTREAITCLFEANNNAGTRFLYAGTQSRLYFLNETTGIWSPVPAPYAMGGTREAGVAQTRFKIAELQEQLVIVNGIDRVMYSTVGSHGMAQIGELANAGTLTSKLDVWGPRVVIEYNGFVLIMNIGEAGIRMGSRVRWSDWNRPTVWVSGLDLNYPDTDPGGTHGEQATLADFQDLDYGSDILAAAELMGALYIFTTTAIWKATIGQTKAFDFVKVYSEPKNGAKCIFFPNTLVSTGADLFYAASDGIYRWNPYIPESERLEWLYRGTAEMFNDTRFAGDSAACQSVIMQVRPDDHEIYVSWPELNAGVVGQNTRTLVFNYVAKAVSSVDFGYAAMVNYRPNPEAGDLCKTEQILVAAAADDWCLKQIGTAYSRERCANAATGKGIVRDSVYLPFGGQFVYDGYYSILRGLLPLGNLDRSKEMSHFNLENNPSPQANPCVVRLRIGNSDDEADPNDPDGTCTVLWYRMRDQPLKCLDSKTAAQYVAANLKRTLGMEWELLASGKFLFYEIVIANADGSAALGGESCFSRIECQIRLLPK